MNITFIYLIAYVVPALSTRAVLKVLPRKEEQTSPRNAIITHSALLVSILASRYFIYRLGLTFPWYPSHLSVAIYILSVLLVGGLLGQKGLWYGLSALLQQLTLLSIAFLLLTVYPLYLVVLLVVPLYVWSHVVSDHQWRLRTLLFVVWGIASIILFSIMPNMYLIASLHTLFGAILIKRSLLYPRE